MVARIASGGMGDVWEAHDEVLERVVAVKVLRASGALYTANLSHPNIATVFDYGEDDALAYLVMELVPGEPLSSLVRREGALDPARVRSIAGQAALALGAAHYLSPEQALGDPATGASDLYGLGVVAHEMLTGRRPFDRNTPVATALAQVNDPPPPLPTHVPTELRVLVEQCLSKRPRRPTRASTADPPRRTLGTRRPWTPRPRLASSRRSRVPGCTGCGSPRRA
jgi:eukaryotic-like serine/threonine-protein kinase